MATRAKALVLKSGRTITLDKLVICAGAYSHLLARQLGEKVLLEAERGYHMVLPNSGVKLSRSLTYASTPGAATPMDMGLRLAGSDEFAGLDAEPNWARADALWKVFKKILPDAQRTRFRHDALDGAPARHAGFAAGHRPLKDGFKCLVWLWPRPHGADLGAFHRPPDQRD